MKIFVNTLIILFIPLLVFSQEEKKNKIRLSLSPQEQIEGSLARKTENYDFSVGATRDFEKQKDRIQLKLNTTHQAFANIPLQTGIKMGTQGYSYGLTQKALNALASQDFKRAIDQHVALSVGCKKETDLASIFKLAKNSAGAFSYGFGLEGEHRRFDKTASRGFVDLDGRPYYKDDLIAGKEAYEQNRHPFTVQGGELGGSPEFKVCPPVDPNTPIASLDPNNPCHNEQIANIFSPNPTMNSFPELSSTNETRPTLQIPNTVYFENTREAQNIIRGYLEVAYESPKIHDFKISLKGRYAPNLEDFVKSVGHDYRAECRAEVSYPIKKDRAVAFIGASYRADLNSKNGSIGAGDEHDEVVDIGIECKF